MARTQSFRHLGELLRVAAYCERTGVPAAEALPELRLKTADRRRFLKFAAGAGMLAASPLRAAPNANGADVAIVGAGFAGLYAATVLAAKRARPQVFEAGDRVGGRVWTLYGFFPSQVAERGGELIDTTHTTLRGLANAYGLTLESYAANKLPGDEAFHFFGQSWTEAEVVEEFRAFVLAMRDDLTQLSNAPTAFSSNETDRRLDFTPLSDYLVQR
jgi:monoamine oxidase